MRIDKLLCELNIGSRSQVKALLKKGAVRVNGEAVTKPETKVEEKTAVILCQGKEYRYQPFVYFMLNKPAGVVTATEDAFQETVLDIFKREYASEHNGELQGIPLSAIFPVGRLDKDTVGLLLLTNNGELAHQLLSPKKHVPKKYYVETNGFLTEEKKRQLEEGVYIAENEKTAPAAVLIEEKNRCFITITEGKFHQVKRMFKAVGLTVTYLKRVSMGALILDGELKEGQIKKLSEEEVLKLCSVI